MDADRVKRQAACTASSKLLRLVSLAEGALCGRCDRNNGTAASGRGLLRKPKACAAESRGTLNTNLQDQHPHIAGSADTGASRRAHGIGA